LPLLCLYALSNPYPPDSSEALDRWILGTLYGPFVPRPSQHPALLCSQAPKHQAPNHFLGSYSQAPHCQASDHYVSRPSPTGSPREIIALTGVSSVGPRLRLPSNGAKVASTNHISRITLSPITSVRWHKIAKQELVLTYCLSPCNIPAATSAHFFSHSI